jgi:hypothetical protein
MSKHIAGYEAIKNDDYLCTHAGCEKAHGVAIITDTHEFAPARLHHHNTVQKPVI